MASKIWVNTSPGNGLVPSGTDDEHQVVDLSVWYCASAIHLNHYILMYRKTHNISRTLVGNKIVDQSDVVGASPVGAAPTTSSFST